MIGQIGSEIFIHVKVKMTLESSHELNRSLKVYMEVCPICYSVDW